ncbi:MAG TPA: hypothetical protein VMT53_07785 [Terriglobales bacterium]|nr:hypothetical protein [Terriglobales bacterium]
MTPETNEGATQKLVPAGTSTASLMTGDRVQIFREVVTAVISVSILTVSVWMMVNTYRAGSHAMLSQKSDEKQNEAEVKAMTDAFGRQKDLLLYALALLGTVTGYYLGRVPAELRAQQAQQTISSSQRQLANTQSQLDTVATAATQTAANLTRARRTLGRIRATLTTAVEPKGESRRTLSDATETPEQRAIFDAQRDIDDYFSNG